MAGFQPEFNRSIAVPQVSIDDYVHFKGLTRVDLVKIDVEGGELEVLLGAWQTLRSFDSEILLELLYTEIPSHRERRKQVIGLLKQLGYAFFRLEENGDPVRQTEVHPDSAYHCSNFLLRRESPAL